MGGSSEIPERSRTSWAPHRSVPLETTALVALLRSSARPPHVYAELVEEAGSARAVLEDEQGLLAEQLIEATAAEVVTWSDQGIRLLTVLDADYPANLRTVYDRPPLIFIAGRLEPRDARSVAVIGSRRATQAGIDRARAVVSHLASVGYTIVSGLAAGIDTAAHVTALAHGARTLAVIGTGLRHAYPPQNATLQERVASTGAVVSQFWPDTQPSRANFPLRNATMSGLSLATVVVEASHTSGARTQIRHARTHGRPVVLTSELLAAQHWARELAPRGGTYVIRSLDELTDTLEALSSTGTLVG